MTDTNLEWTAIMLTLILPLELLDQHRNTIAFRRQLRAEASVQCYCHKVAAEIKVEYRSLI